MREQPSRRSWDMGTRGRGRGAYSGVISGETEGPPLYE